ncbi:hypothetical protein TNCV_3590641 [Trichonephila clavipes]|nr:hypothetical protein TNCV_3590641 [Trichonephila clavipes]
MMKQVGKASPLEIIRVEEYLNIMFSNKSRPTSYAKRNIETGYAISSGRLLIDQHMLLHIKKRKKRKKLTSNWEKRNVQQL